VPPKENRPVTFCHRAIDLSSLEKENHFIVGMTNSAPERMPMRQRDVTVFHSVFSA
jgi:hypothetical protein